MQLNAQIKKLETDSFVLEYVDTVRGETCYNLDFRHKIPVAGEVIRRTQIRIINGEFSAYPAKDFIPDRIMRVLKHVLL